MITLTPYKKGPFAAQSLEDPDPYSLPAIIMVGIPASMYFLAESKTDISVLEGTWREIGPVLLAILLINLVLAKVPLAIMRSFPLLLP